MSFLSEKHPCFAALVCGLLAACNPGGSSAAPESSGPTTSPPTAAAAVPPLRVDAVDGLPDAIAGTTPVWESVYGASSRQSLTATRLYSDGMIYTWSDQRMTPQPGSAMPKVESAPWAWRPIARVDADGVAAVRAAIADSGFGELPSTIVGDGQDGRPRAWRGLLGGRVHEVRTLHAEAPPAITSIGHTMQRGVIPGGISSGP